MIGYRVDPSCNIDMRERDGMLPSFGADADPFQSLRIKSMETTDVSRFGIHETQSTEPQYV